MKKTIYIIISFLICFLFFDIQKIDTEENISLAYNEEIKYEENNFVIKFDNHNIVFVMELLSKYDTEILKIVPKKNIYNIDEIYADNIRDILSYYSSYINDDDNKYYVLNNGFLVHKIYLRCSNETLNSIEKEINVNITSK
ncbi:MAG: hypothetical protein RR228_03565 [Bacilli bacterium]